MGWFGLIITTIFICAIVSAIVYVIFNIVYNASCSPKVYSVISFLASLVMFIILLCTKEGPDFSDGSFQTGSTGLIGFTFIILTLPITNAMISLLEGEDVLQGIGQSIGILAICVAVAVIILCFSSSYWPLVVLTGIAGLTSAITFFRE